MVSSSPNPIRRSSNRDLAKTFARAIAVLLCLVVGATVEDGIAFAYNSLRADHQQTAATRQDQRTEAVVTAVYNEQLPDTAASIADRQAPASQAILQAYYARNYPGFRIKLAVWRGKQFGGELIRVEGTSPTGHVFRLTGGGSGVYAGVSRTCGGAGKPGACYLVRLPGGADNPGVELNGTW